jgi:biotin operon repressor
VGNKISRWAKRQLPQLRSTGEKLVLMALAVDADGDGTCDPETSLNKIAADCGISRTTAKTALGRLRDAKLLEVAQRLREDGSHDKNGYRLAIKGGAESGPPLGQNLPHPPGGKLPHPWGSNWPRGVGQNLAHL